MKNDYDICYFNHESHGKMVERLKSFGFKGAYFLIKFTNKNDFEKYLNDFKNSEAKDLGCKSCVLIETDKPGNIQKICQQVKGKVDIVVVRGLNEDVFRKASETKGVGMITGFIDKENKLLVDYVTMNFCKENNVAVNFGFSELLQREGVGRAHFAKEMFEAAKIARKRKAPLMVSSLAANEWELRGKSEIEAFRKVLGLI
ncbi:MAG: hypothetical protein JW716_05835 [Candidatus Aenigmarchaeota archaeon]|nr:hypothetical protein [Candidatus Aenigmarchaeota archaeon]